jgi:tetratricopeptide (TPR) repeat protein
MDTMRTPAVLCAALTLSSIALSQQQQVQMNQVQVQQGGPADTGKPKPLTKEEQRRVQQLLEGAEAGTASLDAASRIISYTELARAYQLSDKKKAVELLESALSSTRNLQLESANERLNDQLKRQLMQRVVRDFSAVAPERLDALMDEVPAETRANAIELLIPYYGKTNQLGRANELVMRVAQEGEMPYPSASALMGLYGKDRSDEVRALFVSSLASYQAHEHTSSFRSGNDFPDMIAKFHEQLSNPLAKQAIDEVLAQAKKADEKTRGSSISLASGKGAVSFDSTYGFRLFQLMPTLRTIDPQAAEKLLKEQQDVNTLAAKYPDGMDSLRSGDGQSGNMLMTVGMGGGSGGGGGARRGGPASASPLELQRMAQITEDAQKHPQDALANAAALSPELAGQAYVSIARVTQKSEPSVARAALAKASALLDKAPLEQQLIAAQNITDLYMKMGEKEKAKDTLDQSLAVANRMYKKDTDADDPNTAPKAYWASTNGYRSIMSNAGKIDSSWAMNLMKEVPDDGIRVFNQIAMANALLGTPGGGFQIITATKGGVSMTFMNNAGN